MDRVSRGGERTGGRDGGWGMGGRGRYCLCSLRGRTSFFWRMKRC